MTDKLGRPLTVGDSVVYSKGGVGRELTLGRIKKILPPTNQRQGGAIMEATYSWNKSGITRITITKPDYVLKLTPASVSADPDLVTEFAKI